MENYIEILNLEEVKNLRESKKGVKKIIPEKPIFVTSYIDERIGKDFIKNLILCGEFGSHIQLEPLSLYSEDFGEIILHKIDFGVSIKNLIKSLRTSYESFSIIANETENRFEITEVLMSIRQLDKKSLSDFFKFYLNNIV